MEMSAVTQSLDRTIHRVRLTVQRSQLVQLPPDARVLSVQLRQNEPGDQLDLWAEVTPREPKRIMFYTVVLVATGDPVPVGMRYISSVQLRDGQYVLHAYAKESQPEAPRSGQMGHQEESGTGLPGGSDTSLERSR